MDNKLEAAARQILGNETLNSLREWYEELHGSQWNYVIFIARRCYILALMLEKITGLPMHSNCNTVFLTDAAFFLRCDELAMYYKKHGYFPAIQINDDTLLHGRNINHLLKQIERRLCELLTEYDDEEIVNALMDAIQINVYMRYNGPLLLMTRYEVRLHCKESEKLAECHQFSNAVSTLITCSNIANASYVFSEYLSEDQFEKIDINEFKSSYYHNVKQYTWIKLVETEDFVKAALTLRIIKNDFHDGYRVIPFAFLPNLDSDETQMLFERIAARISNAESVGWWKKFDEIEGKRSFNELLTLLFSHSILQNFNQKYNICVDDADRHNEMEKLVRNYNDVDAEKTEYYLSTLMQDTLFDEGEQEVIIKECISNLRYLANKELLGGLERKEEILEKVQKEFFEMGYRQEDSAYQMKLNMYNTQVERMSRSVRGACFLWQKLFVGFSLKGIEKAFTYILQMMDAGVLALSSYGSERIKVVGYAQFVKEGELSLFLYPIAVDVYLPMLRSIEYNCEHTNSSLRDEFINFYHEGQCSISEKDRDKIETFIEKFGKIGQKPSDWKCNLLLRQEFLLEEEFTMKRMKQYLDERSKYLQEYTDYVKKE